jgi:L-ascorbate metabolism protein UlaG (beta-lactamase superfamily)
MANGDGTIFRDIRARHGSPDIALIPIGAYEPRWFMTPQHTNPAESVSIFTELGPGRAIGIHWGTFRLTNESRDAPRFALTASLKAQGIDAHRFVAAEPGMIVER